MAYLAELAASVITIINSEDYGRTIYDLHLRRQLIALSEEIGNQAFEHSLEHDAHKMIEMAEGRLYQIAETGQMRNGSKSLDDAAGSALGMAIEAFSSDGAVVGIPTGLRTSFSAACIRLIC